MSLLFVLVVMSYLIFSFTTLDAFRLFVQTFKRLRGVSCPSGQTYVDDTSGSVTPYKWMNVPKYQQMFMSLCKVKRSIILRRLKFIFFFRRLLKGSFHLLI